MSQVLQSFIGGQWIGQQGAQALRSALNGQTVYQTHAEAIDFGDAVHYARTVGLPNLLKLDFQERAQRLKALAKYLGEHKELLYAISATPVPHGPTAGWTSKAARALCLPIRVWAATSCPAAT